MYRMFLLDVEFELYTPRDCRCHSELALKNNNTLMYNKFAYAIE
jgi:hypothetical protein